MNKIYVIIIVVLCGLFLNCRKPANKIISYDRYNDKNHLIKRKAYQLNIIRNSEDVDFISVVSHSKDILKFEQKEVNNQGVFRVCKDTLIRTHSFSDTASLFRYCLIKKPFLNKEVQLIGSKEYIILDKHYRLFHYSESNGTDSTYDSYYLKGIGFICYYSFNRNEYIIADTTNIEGIPLRKITKCLISDTSFFAKYTLPKIFPNYYRVKKR